MELFNSFLSLVGDNSTIVIVVSVIAAGLAAITLTLDYRNERRARDTFGIERRRLSEVNLKIEQNVELVPMWQADTSQGEQKQGAFMVLKMPMKNIGDGPIDILGMLVSARQLTYAAWERGIGARSRDVEFDDYQTSYWNDADLNGRVFAGISTTKFLINAADNFTRFSAQESGTMRRVDAIHDVDALQRGRSVTVMYRVFAVARGYALGEVLRQLGGGPPDPATNVRQELLQFQRLAQPNYRRWRYVQQALINLNRFAFRLAIFDLENPQTSGDPLGILVKPDAWRIFLLHHWEFVDDLPHGAPRTLPKELKTKYELPLGHMERANSIAVRYFPTRRLPDVWTDEDKSNIAAAHQECAAELREFVAAWQRLQEAIQICEQNAFSGRARKGTPNEGYPRMIHTVDEYRARWLALMDEGYLVSKPFFRARVNVGIIQAGGRRTRLNEHDIPDDPRVLEPYVMRSYYFLSTLDALAPNRAGSTPVAGH